QGLYQGASSSNGEAPGTVSSTLGEGVYKDGIKDIDITSDMIDEELKAAMWDTVRLVIGSEENCHRVPSHYECQFCEVPKEECPHKVN
ncbi:hypothetical protein LCGC14_2392650, partial [marine sediment metagenome]